MVDLVPPRYLRRRDAAKYLKEVWGIDFAPRTLAKIACTSSDGPAMRYIGRRPYYQQTALDDFAARKLGPVRRSTSDKSRRRSTSESDAA